MAMSPDLRRALDRLDAIMRVNHQGKYAHGDACLVRNLGGAIPDPNRPDHFIKTPCTCGVGR